MIFNRGFKCPNCGPIPKSDKRKISKISRDCCPDCKEVVTPWSRPLNERAGRCGNCAGAAFKLAVVKGQLLRNCKVCGMVVNTDDDNKVIREGDKEHAINKTV